MVAPNNEKLNAAFKSNGGFDLSVPYPFMLEPVAQPWLGWRYGHGQIVTSGVGRGLGMSSPQFYCKFLEGNEIVETFNKRFAATLPGTDSYIDQASAVKTFLLKIKRLQADKSSFFDIQQTGVNWASSSFTDYLMAGLDEAYAIAVYSPSCDTMEISRETLHQLVAPLIHYKKAEKGWQALISSPKFGHFAKLRAYHGCIAFCLKNYHCPWHKARFLSMDAETGQVMQVCLQALRETEAFPRMEKRVTAFLRGCTLHRGATANAICVEDKLINWLEQCRDEFTPKSLCLMRHNMSS